MKRSVSAFGIGLVLAGMALALPALAKERKVISDKTVAGFGNNESVAFDFREKVFYTGDFGSGLKPAEKDGKGKINKVSMDGKIIEAGVFPAAGQTMNKPKGIWIRGRKMWVADVDAVWIFDLKSKASKRLALPIGYANDVALIRNKLFISDNRADEIVTVEPADFLKSKKEPKITSAMKGKGIFPNGIYPANDGSLLIVGFKSKDEPLGIYSMAAGKDPKPLVEKVGQLDGLYQMSDGDILYTDWITGSLNQWSPKTGSKKLVGDIKGPADFCVVPNKQGLLLAIPDLVKGEIRFVQLSR